MSKNYNINHYTNILITRYVNKFFRKKYTKYHRGSRFFQIFSGSSLLPYIAQLTSLGSGAGKRTIGRIAFECPNRGLFPDSDRMDSTT